MSLSKARQLDASHFRTTFASRRNCLLNHITVASQSKLVSERKFFLRFYQVWYHANCTSRGRGCFDTRLVSSGGCCIWYNEKQLLGEIEEHLGITIDTVSKDLQVPANEFDGKVVYGQKLKNGGYCSLWFPFAYSFDVPMSPLSICCSCTKL